MNSETLDSDASQAQRNEDVNDHDHDPNARPRRLARNARRIPFSASNGQDKSTERAESGRPSKRPPGRPRLNRPSVTRPGLDRVKTKHPGRRRVPNPDATTEADLVRQAELKRVFKSVCKAVKPALAELAGRSLEELEADPFAHENHPNYRLVQDGLDTRLKERKIEAESIYQLELESLTRIYQAQKSIVHNDSIRQAADVRDDLLLRAKDNYLSLVRDSEVYDDDQATDNEEPEVDTEMDAQQNSRSDYFVDVQRRWTDLEVRSRIRTALSRYAPDFATSANTGYASYDASNRDAAIATLNLEVLADASQAAVETSEQTASPLTRNSDVEKLVALATASEACRLEHEPQLPSNSQIFPNQPLDQTAVLTDPFVSPTKPQSGTLFGSPKFSLKYPAEPPAWSSPTKVDKHQNRRPSTAHHSSPVWQPSLEEHATAPTNINEYSIQTAGSRDRRFTYPQIKEAHHQYHNNLSEAKTNLDSIPGHDRSGLPGSAIEYRFAPQEYQPPPNRGIDRPIHSNEPHIPQDSLAGNGTGAFGKFSLSGRRRKRNNSKISIPQAPVPLAAKPVDAASKIRPRIAPSNTFESNTRIGQKSEARNFEWKDNNPQAFRRKRGSKDISGSVPPGDTPKARSHPPLAIAPRQQTRFVEVNPGKSHLTAIVPDTASGMKDMLPINSPPQQIQPMSHPTDPSTPYESREQLARPEPTRKPPDRLRSMLISELITDNSQDERLSHTQRTSVPEPIIISAPQSVPVRASQLHHIDTSTRYDPSYHPTDTEYHHPSSSLARGDPNYSRDTRSSAAPYPPVPHGYINPHNIPIPPPLQYAQELHSPGREPLHALQHQSYQQFSQPTNYSLPPPPPPYGKYPQYPPINTQYPYTAPPQSLPPPPQPPQPPPPPPPQPPPSFLEPITSHQFGYYPYPSPTGGPPPTYHYQRARQEPRRPW